MTRSKPFATLGVAVALAACASARTAAGGSVASRAEETRVDRLPRGTSAGDCLIDFAADASRAVAVCAGADGKRYAYSQGRRSDAYDRIDGEELSPDGRRLFFVGVDDRGRERAYSVAVDFRVQGVYDRPPGDPAFSRDGRVAYKVEVASGVARVPGFPELPIVKTAVVVDGVPGAWRDGFVDDPAFDPATGRLAYLFHARGGWRVESGGAERPVVCPVPADGIAQSGFDATGRLYVFSTRASCVEADGVRLPPYERLGMIQFDRWTGGLAYVGARGGKEYVASSRGESGPYDRVFKLGVRDDAPLWSASRDGATLVATPSAEFELESLPDTCAASRDLRHVACLSGRDGAHAASVDGRVVAEYPPGGAGPAWSSALRLDPAGRRVAYEMRDGDSSRFEVRDSSGGGAWRTPAYDAVYAPEFVDGGALRFGAARGRDLLKVVATPP
jgi:hypothetical protein